MTVKQGMRIYRDSKALRRKAKGAVVTLGNFDGLHLGHQKIIRKVVSRAEALGSPSVVYTFEPHPLKVIAPHKSPPLIIDTKTKAGLIEAMGIDYLIVARFTKEFASKHPRTFVEEELLPLSLKEVWVGHDFSFGKGKAGTVEFLEELGREHGFGVHVIPAYSKGARIVSSSRIRLLIGEGKVREAARLLGRDFAMKGRVVRGKDIGKAIGFPTANLKAEGEIIPADGVYAAYATVSGKRLRAVVNIGTAPTFGCNERCVEAHILGFKGSIYGREIGLEFVSRLRGERTFKSKEALVTQIKKDIARAKRILG